MNRFKYKNIYNQFTCVALFAAGLAGLVFALTSPVLAQNDPPSLPVSSDLDDPSATGLQEGDLNMPDFLSDDILGFENNDDDFSLEKSRQQLEEEARNEAFKAAIDGLLPLRPKEIRVLLEKFDRARESVETPIYPAPEPKMVVENVSLDPGAAPAKLKTAFGHVTTLSILDITGAHWPIEDISWAGDFEINETSTGEGSHILRISPKEEYASGNISMKLLTLKTPVIIAIETNRDIVHYRFDAIIPEYGPFAKTPIINKGLEIQAGNSTLSSILQGVIPNGTSRMNISGVDGRTSAYQSGALTFVRTPLTLLSPSWNNSVASADGMRVYALKSAPVLLLSDKGKMVRAHLSKRENIFDE